MLLFTTYNLIKKNLLCQCDLIEIEKDF